MRPCIKICKLRSPWCEPALIVSAIAALVLGSESLALAAAPQLELELVTAGLHEPVVIAFANDGSGRLFVAQQDGVIRIIDGMQIRSTPFLDLSSSVSAGGERGLLGLAFHPDSAANGHF